MIINIKKYSLLLLVALLLCTFMVGASYINGGEINIYSLVLSFVFGLFFVPLVVIKLPVFKNHYNHDMYTFDGKYPTLANVRAAPVMVFLVVAAVLALFFYLTDFEKFELSIVCGAIAAGTISFYYEH